MSNEVDKIARQLDWIYSERRKLRRALKKYGEHFVACGKSGANPNYNSICDCGLDKALEKKPFHDSGGK